MKRLTITLTILFCLSGFTYAQQDTTPPRVTIGGIAEGQVTCGRTNIYIISFDAGGLRSFSLFVDNELEQTVSATNLIKTYFVLNTRKLSEGAHTLTLTATDAAGNVGVSEPVTINVQCERGNRDE